MKTVPGSVICFSKSTGKANGGLIQSKGFASKHQRRRQGERGATVRDDGNGARE